MALLDTIELFSNFSLSGVEAGLALASLLVSKIAVTLSKRISLPFYEG